MPSCWATTRDYAAALKAVEGAAVVLVLDDPQVAVRPAGALIYLGTVLPDDAGPRTDADLVLPITNVAEEEGTFVNRDGRVQRYWQAKPAPGMARPAWWVLGEILARLGTRSPPPQRRRRLTGWRTGRRGDSGG